MALKLLPPNQAQFQTRARSEKDERRAVELQSLIVAKHKELAEIEQMSEESLSRHRELWASEERAHEEKLRTLRAETVSLEERKKEAIVPLTAKKEELDTIESTLHKHDQELRSKRADMDEEAELLKSKLDEVSERALQLDERSDRLAAQEQGAKLQEEQVRAMSERFSEFFAKRTKEINDQAQSVQLQEASLKTKELQIQERERIVQITSDSFAAREKALQDKYETLARTQERIYGKQRPER